MSGTLVRPTLILDEEKCKTNIAHMAAKAKRHGLAFRPHFKTHQSHTVGRWFRDAGVMACTVSSAEMARYFADDGWDDITLAFPVNHHEAGLIDALAARIRLNVLAVNAEALQELSRKVRHPVGVWVEIDTGDHRTGIDPGDGALLETILNVVEAAPQFRFKGFLSHAGHSYQCRTHEAIERVHRTEVDIHRQLKEKFQSRYPNMIASIGDTPSMSCSEYFDGIDEIRPGNFAFYDLTQVAIGSCEKKHIAVALASPVVAIYPQREEAVIHGGAVHLSKDVLRLPDGSLSYGEVYTMPMDVGRPPVGRLKSLSQEHGVVHLVKQALANLKVGDFLAVLPVHSCLAADAMRSYLTTSGEAVPTMRS